MKNDIEIKSVKGVYQSNTFAVTLDGTTLVIDAGAPVGKLVKILDGKRPAAVLMTHEHFDHTYHLEDYKKAFECPVFTPTDEKEITVGAIKVKPLLCPGHSPNSVVYLIEDSLFTGDVLFADTIGRTDLMPNGEQLMQKTLRELASIKFNTAYHGHGPSSTYADQQKNIAYFIE